MSTDLLKSFHRHLALERGLARNTCLAYAGDIGQYFRYCGAAGQDPAVAGSEFIEEYLWKLKHISPDRSLKASTLFRKMEAVRAFYKFLMIEGKVQKDPTRNFRAPRIPD